MNGHTGPKGAAPVIPLGTKVLPFRASNRADFQALRDAIALLDLTPSQACELHRLIESRTTC